MLRVLERLEEWLIALLLTVMTLITFTQVVARYVFNFSFVWALELNTFLFAWLIFLGAAYGVRHGAHALVKSLSPGKARVTAIAAALLCMVYAGIVLVGGWVYVAKMYQVGIMAEDLPIPQWVPRLVLPIGGTLLFLRFGQVLYRLIIGKEAHLLGDEAKEAIRQQLEETAEPPEGRG
jgi:C4-dicarboxylate transporter DctQ subunit